MKNIIVFTALLMTGCGGLFIEQTPMIGGDGSKIYLLKNWVGPENAQEYSQKEMAERANQICPSGYELIHEESHNPNHFITQTKAPFGRYLYWQIKCKA